MADGQAAVVGADPATGATYTQTPAQAAATAAPATAAPVSSIATGDTPADPTKPSTDPAKPGDTAAFDATKITMPEGLKADPALMEKFSGIAKEYGLSQDAAQKLVDLQAQTIKDATTANAKAFEDVQTKWQDEVRADPVVGGANLPAVTQTIGRALTQYGTPGIKQALDMTGAGNNPEIVKTLYAMSKALTEGRPTPAPVPVAQQTSMAQRMYPNQGR